MQGTISRALRVLSIGVVLTLWSGLIAAGQSDLVGLTDFPAPPWPGEPATIEELREQYVYLDLSNNEYVLAYPEYLDRDCSGEGDEESEDEEPPAEPAEPCDEDDPGPLRIDRYELLRSVEPEVRVAVTPDGTGAYRYAYTVANSPSAPQNIEQWVLVLPGQAGAIGVAAPEGWFGLFQARRSFKLRDPAWMPNGAAALWSFSKPEGVIPAGGVVAGFGLESDLGPGFTVGYFKQAVSTGARMATSGYVPKPVRDQMADLLRVEYNSRTVLMLGPRFGPAADAHEIAQDYIQGLFVLSRSGALDLSSDFVRTLLSELTSIQPGSAPASIRITASATTPLEEEILAALRLALRVD